MNSTDSGAVAPKREPYIKKAHSRQPKVHHFSPDIVKRVRKCFQTDNWHGPLEVLEDWSVIICAAFGSIYAWNHFAKALAIAIYVLAVFIIGGRQRGLADILHQASHKTLTKSQWLGSALGTVFSGYPLLQSMTGYFASHVALHHPYLADPELDPDYAEYRRRGLTGQNMRKHVLRRYLLSLFGVRSVIGYSAYLVRNRVLNPQEKAFERWIRFVYASAVFGICAWHGWLPILIAYWLIPLFTTHAWIGAFIELLEHYPLVETALLVDIYLTRNRECGRFGNFLLGIQTQEGYHLVHHRFPHVPRWRLREVHQILLEDSEYAALHQVKGWTETLRQLFAIIPA